jgi:hypothetical protein
VQQHSLGLRLLESASIDDGKSTDQQVFVGEQSVKPKEVSGEQTIQKESREED